MSENKRCSSSGGAGCGCYMIGMPVAAVCSWLINHSIWWAIFHAIFWWLYLIYLCMGCGGGWPQELRP